MSSYGVGKSNTNEQRIKEMQAYVDDLKDKPRFLDTIGRTVTANDETRVIWFSARCSYWTDDWTKLAKTLPHGIPICPNCSSPGMQAQYKDWIRSAKRYEDNVAPNYIQYIMYSKEKCVTQKNGKPIPMKEVYKLWFANQQKGIETLNNALSNGINKIEDK